MAVQRISCPGGSTSQTGTAVLERYDGVEISNCGTIPDVPSLLERSDSPFVVPVWNSHQGEIKTAEYIWNNIEDSQIRLSDMWAKSIQFWYVRRTGTRKEHGKIGSVPVAATQCSEFLKAEGLQLVPSALTTTAFEEYRVGALWDGVLVAPGQGEGEAQFEIIQKSTANPNNFTSFVRFTKLSLAPLPADGGSWITGVGMRQFGTAFGETELSLFENMLRGISNFSDIPKLILVLKRTAKVGLLFEGPKLHVADLLDAEELEGGSISIYEEAGTVEKQYTSELKDLFSKEFPTLLDGDFVLQRGVKTCLFCCPPLGLFTHGFDEEVVEPVIRFYIGQLFRLWNDGVTCTDEQNAFFSKYKGAWEAEGSEFITFTVISA